MSVMYLLILLSLILASGFVIAFVWAIRSGQYDDKYTPSVRVLFDDHPVSDENHDNEDDTQETSEAGRGESSAGKTDSEHSGN